MADKIVILEDSEGNNIYPISRGLATNSVDTNAIQNGAVTSAKIDYATMDYGSGPIPVGEYNGRVLYRKIITTKVPTTSTSGTDVSSTYTFDSNATWSVIEWGGIIVPAGNDRRRRQTPFITSDGYKIRLTAGSNIRYGDITINNDYAPYSDCDLEVSVLYTID